jgi:tetratricopeptide (TPR) repeat protein
MNYGLTLMGRGDTAKALDYFERAAVLNPNYALLEINRAIAKNALGKPVPEIENHFLRALQLTPDQSTPYYYYGRWLFEKNRREQAASNVSRALQLNPSDFGARSLLCQIYAAMNQWKELGDLIEDTLRIAPTDPSALHYKGVLEAARGKTVQMAAAASKTRTPESYLELSLAHFQAGRYMDCVRSAQEAVKMRPNYAEAYNNIAAGYNALKMWDEGIKAASEAVRLKPDWELARNNLAHAIRQKAAQGGTGK